MGLPCLSSSEDSVFPAKEMWVWSLIQTLRSHMLQDKVKKFKKKTLGVPVVDSCWCMWNNYPSVKTKKCDAEALVLWPPHAKSWLIGKDSDAGRDWGQEEKGTTEDEMAGWHHWLDGRESEWTPGVSDGQGGLVCCNSWGHKESDTTEWLNWLTEVGGKGKIKVGNNPNIPQQRIDMQILVCP